MPFSRKQSKQTTSQIVSMVMFIAGIALITWYATDIILTWQGYRAEYINIVLSMSRVITGVILIFAALWISGTPITLRY